MPNPHPYFSDRSRRLIIRLLHTTCTSTTPTTMGGDDSPGPSASVSVSRKPSASSHRKLLKRRRPGSRPRSLHFPPQLELGADADEDVTSAPVAPETSASISSPLGRSRSGTAASQRPAFLHLNQSVFSLIATAGSTANFHGPDLGDDASSGDGSGSETEGESGSKSRTTKRPLASKDTEKRSGSPGDLKESSTPPPRLPSRHEIGESTPNLGSKALKTTASGRRSGDYMSHSVILPPRQSNAAGDDSPPALTPRDAPVMSRILEARARLEDQHEEVFEKAADELSPKTKPPGVGVEGKPSVSLKQRLKEIFGLEKEEEVLSGAFDDLSVLLVGTSSLLRRVLGRVG